jgi:hypothetical protein
MFLNIHRRISFFGLILLKDILYRKKGVSP